MHRLERVLWLPVAALRRSHCHALSTSPLPTTGQSKEQEEQRVQKELANIRMKFTAKKALSAYDRRK